ncbi:hypothetical protein BS17DRAFT_794273 [Gyrodon lividus]|nr:hypothetical protein BS17DRAFT_794273 [Gyrodon lividus]
MPFVQPCDTGIICCFKAIYCCKLSTCTIDLNEAGEPEIYTINLLEAMLTAKSAWDAVSPETIKHCWDHTQIQQDKMNLPNAEACLVAHLGHRYVNTDWWPAPRAVMDAERDVSIAMKAIPAANLPPQLSNAEKMLMTSVSALHEHNHIFGKLLPLEKILDPAEE